MNTNFISNKHNPDEYSRAIKKNFDEITDGLVSEDVAVSFIKTVLPAAEPCKYNHDCWFWMYEEPSNMPSDCRVEYVYETTYRMTGIIIYALCRYESVKSIDGIFDTLRYVLKGCMGREFMGHGFEYYGGFVTAMRIFARANINAFVKEYADEFAEFIDFFNSKRPLLEDLASGKIIGDFGESYSDRAIAILDLLDRPFRPIRVFVYGTLMKGQRAHHYLENAGYEGEYTLGGFSMYDLGSFPGIKPEGIGLVPGEVYTIDEEMLSAIDCYEGEGNLYDREEVCVRNDTKTIFAYAYVYKDEPEGKLIEGRWGING